MQIKVLGEGGQRWAEGVSVAEQRALTRSAPACSSTSATSVWPFSQAYVSAVSPVAVVA